MMHCEDSECRSSSSPFLKTFLRTDRGWDDAAQAEWADDVERRLREVTARIEPEVVQLGYSIKRVKNCIAIYTVTPDEQSKQDIAALSRDEWPFWSEIINAVPELAHSKTTFDATTSMEWWRKWDVEDEMRRFRFEHGFCA